MRYQLRRQYLEVPRSVEFLVGGFMLISAGLACANRPKFVRINFQRVNFWSVECRLKIGHVFSELFDIL